jgi:outer membrane beta-barrel protein
MRSLAAAVLVLAIAMVPMSSFASDVDKGGLRTLAVQNRQHEMTHEFTFWFGTLPVDAFEKGLTFSGGYTLHFNDIIAWEVGKYSFSYRIDADLKAELEQIAVEPTPFEVVKQYVTSNFVFKPIYGKMAALNRALLYGELYLLVGGGYGWMTLTNRPIVDVGVGGRIYAGKVISFRVDLRDLMFFNKDDLQNELSIAVGIAVGF